MRSSHWEPIRQLAWQNNSNHLNHSNRFNKQQYSINRFEAGVDRTIWKHYIKSLSFRHGGYWMSDVSCRISTEQPLKLLENAWKYSAFLSTIAKHWHHYDCCGAKTAKTANNPINHALAEFGCEIQILNEFHWEFRKSNGLHHFELTHQVLVELIIIDAFYHSP